MGRNIQQSEQSAAFGDVEDLEEAPRSPNIKPPQEVFPTENPAALIRRVYNGTSRLRCQYQIFLCCVVIGCIILLYIAARLSYGYILLLLPMFAVFITIYFFLIDIFALPLAFTNEPRLSCPACGSAAVNPLSGWVCPECRRVHNKGPGEILRLAFMRRWYGFMEMSPVVGPCPSCHCAPTSILCPRCKVEIVIRDRLPRQVVRMYEDWDDVGWNDRDKPGSFSERELG